MNTIYSYCNQKHQGQKVNEPYRTLFNKEAGTPSEAFTVKEQWALSKCAVPRRRAAARPRRSLELAAPGDLWMSLYVCWSTGFKCQEVKGFTTVQNALGHCKCRKKTQRFLPRGRGHNVCFCFEIRHRRNYTTRVQLCLRAWWGNIQIYRNGQTACVECIVHLFDGVFLSLLWENKNSTEPDFLWIRKKNPSQYIGTLGKREVVGIQATRQQFCSPLFVSSAVQKSLFYQTRTKIEQSVP